jgi:hypothetical protein
MNESLEMLASVTQKELFEVFELGIYTTDKDHTFAVYVHANQLFFKLSDLQQLISEKITSSGDYHGSNQLYLSSESIRKLPMINQEPALLKLANLTKQTVFKIDFSFLNHWKSKSVSLNPKVINLYPVHP